MNLIFRYFLCIYLCILPLFMAGQNLEGTVFSESGIPLPGAVVRFLNSQNNTVTNEDGKFRIKRPNPSERLIVSFISFQSDTIETAGKNFIKIFLRENQLDQVDIVEDVKERSLNALLDLERIGEKEIKTAACCNLSEAFNKNASVDVVYSDAVTGAKEIRLLGLDGYYAQILIENQPAVRGLNYALGVQHIPGQWMRGISVTKGSGSVINGYDALSGQINVEYKQPDKTDLFSINLFASHQGYFEANADFSYRLNDRTSTASFLHLEGRPFTTDFNKDQFVDNPLQFQVNLLHRWKYDNQKNFEAKVMGGFINETRKSGNYQSFNDPSSENAYKIELNTRRYDLFANTGFYLPKGRSLGIQYRFYRHEMSALFGRRDYDGKQHLGAVNLIYDHPFESQASNLKLGASFMYDRYDERFDTIHRFRSESVPGIFAEYSFHHKEIFDFVAGLRFDYNLWFKTAWWIPRLHVRYQPIEPLVIRASAGRAYRTPNPFAENLSSFISSRNVIIDNDIRFEDAWNVGTNFTLNVPKVQDELIFSISYYYTHFTKQFISDRENARLVQMYMSQGGYSHSIQADVYYEPIEGLNFKAAFKYEEVKQNLREGTNFKPLVPRFKGLFAATYTTSNKKWTFTAGTQIIGPSRIPSTRLNPEVHSFPNWSKPFVILNAQINYIVKKRWDIYVGAENMLNIMQHHAILSSDQPNGTFFDASLIYAPVDGVRVYTGFRYSIPYEKSKR